MRGKNAGPVTANVRDILCKRTDLLSFTGFSCWTRTMISSMNPRDLSALAAQRCGFVLSDDEYTVVKRLCAGGEIAFEEEVEVRAGLLRWLLTDEATKPFLGASTLRLDRVRVKGELDLSATSIGYAIRFRRVVFEGDVLLYLARTRTLIFEACEGRQIKLDDATIDGNVLVGELGDRGCLLDCLSLRDARVSRNVDIRYTMFGDPSEAAAGPSINLARTAVGGSLFIAPGNTVWGGIAGADMRVAGNVDLVDLVASSPGSSPAIQLRRARIEGSLFLHAPDKEDTPAGGTPPRNGCTDASGAVVLWKAKVGGDLALHGLSVRRFDREPSATRETAVGEWWGINLGDADVGGSVYLNNASVWDGGVQLSHIRVGGNLECDQLVLMRSGEAGETGRRASVMAAVSGTTGRGTALEAVLARVGKVLIWRVIGPRSETVVLSGSTVGTFEYSSVYWPERAHLQDFAFTQLNALNYPFRHKQLAKLAGRRLGWRANDPPAGRLKRLLHDRLFLPDRTHLDWIRTSSKSGWAFDRALYNRVAAALMRQGQPGDAQRVLIAATTDGNRARGWGAVLLGVPYFLFAGNGYRPHRALAWAVALVIVGAVVFGRSYAAGELVPVRGDAVAQPFDAIIYSADTLLPIVDLHQEKSFEAAGPDSKFVRTYLWIQIALGWIIATTLGAAAAGFVRRVGNG